MKICTYNIWNDSKDFSKRIELLVQEINNNDVDFIALQEVKDEETFKTIQSQTHFQYGFYYNEIGVLSKNPLNEVVTHNKDNCYIQRVFMGNIAFTNVHLDYKVPSNRAEGIYTVLDFIEENQKDIEIILGDFNETPDDSIHFDLILDNFHDLHKEYAHQINEIPLPTLDFQTNPRWVSSPSLSEPLRCDWIMLYTDQKYKINTAKIIGTKQTNNITPSDHYGVLVDIVFE